MVNETSGTPAVKSAQERVLKGSGVAEKKASERQRLGIRRAEGACSRQKDQCMQGLGGTKMHGTIQEPQADKRGCHKAARLETGR